MGGEAEALDIGFVVLVRDKEGIKVKEVQEMQEGRITRYGMIVEKGVEYMIIPRTNGIAMCKREGKINKVGNETLFDETGKLS